MYEGYEKIMRIQYENKMEELRKEEIKAKKPGALFVVRLKRAAFVSGRRADDILKEAKINPCNLTDWKGGTSPTWKTVKKVAEVLGVEPESLLPEEKCGVCGGKREKPLCIIETFEENPTTKDGVIRMFLSNFAVAARNAGMTTKQAVVKAGLTCTPLQSWEKGEKGPAWSTVEKLANVLGVAPETLIPRELYTTPKKGTPKLRKQMDARKSGKDMSTEEADEIVKGIFLMLAYSLGCNRPGIEISKEDFAEGMGAEDNVVEALLAHPQLLGKIMNLGACMKKVIPEPAIKHQVESLRRAASAL